MKKFARRKLLRHNFNRVEILLAAIVIAIGLAGTFVLFPMGAFLTWKSTKDSALFNADSYLSFFKRFFSKEFWKAGFKLMKKKLLHRK